MTEVIDKSDPRANSPEMRAAVSHQDRDLLNRGTSKVAHRE